MTNSNIDPSARLIHEAIQELGWQADPNLIADRVRRLDIGLPAEDEFIFILSWLGKCSLIHKLDQGQHPPNSTDIYQVPDLLAVFVTKLGIKPVLIEIKTSNENKLDWKPEYLDKLKNYANLINIPLLVAWKYHRFWILVDINHFAKAITNFHLDLNTAMKNNLMSYLAGDFAYTLQPNVGLHFVMRKKKLLSATEIDDNNSGEQWSAIIEKAFFTNSSGLETSVLPTGLWPLFLSSDFESQNRVEQEYIYQDFVTPQDPAMNLAHVALSALLGFSTEEQRIHWRKQLEEHSYPIEFEKFKKAAEDGIAQGYVKYGFDQMPANIPGFLNH